MIEVILSLLFGVLVLFYLELQHRKGKLSTESSRKILHVVTGLILVTWPFFVDWYVIFIVEIIYLVVAMLVRKFMPFESQHKVARKSWGEFFYSFGVIFSILLGAPRWIFVVAILHLALADAAAALIGVRYGKNTKYSVFGQNKSMVGSAAFFAVSLLIVGLTFVFVPGYITADIKLRLLLLPFITTAVENIGAYGTDNFLIPVATILLLGV